MSKVITQTVSDHAGVIDFMDDYKPMIHLRKLVNGFRMKGLIKIPEGMSHSVPGFEDEEEIMDSCNNERSIIVNVDEDINVTESYIISIEVEFKPPVFKKVPVIGIRVISPEIPEEGSTMVGEDDADERP